MKPGNRGKYARESRKSNRDHRIKGVFGNKLTQRGLDLFRNYLANFRGAPWSLGYLEFIHCH